MKGHRSGVTIIELMVALAVASIAFAALAYSQITGFRVTRSSQGSALAKDIGMKQLEHIRGLGFDVYRDCPATGPSEDSGLPTCDGSATDAEHPGFTVHWNITASPAGIAPVPALSTPALKGVEVWVTWEDSRYDLIGYLSCGDPGETATTEVPCPNESLRSGAGS